MKNWKESAKKGVIKIGNLLLLIVAFLAIIYCLGIIPGIIGGIIAYCLSVLGKFSSELTILVVVLASLFFFLMARRYYEENGLSCFLIDYRHSEENENNNPIAPSVK